MASIFKRGGKANRHGRYYIQFFDHRGRRITKSAKTTDKATAERIAAKLEADSAQRREGLVDVRLEALRDRGRSAIDDLLAEYEAALTTANRDAKHVKSTLSMIRAICTACGFKTAASISIDPVNQYATKLRAAGKSARTIQAALTAIRSFTRWMKLAHDPLAELKKPNPETDRRRQRRMLLPAEWQCLHETTSQAPERFGMSGRERMLLYATAIQTGLRSNELRQLTRGRLFLTGSKPYIFATARTTKNGKDASQYIKPDLAAELREHISAKAPRTPVFAMPDPSDVARMAKADLADARRAWLRAAGSDVDERARRELSDFLAVANDEGEVFDFHSFRHTTGAWLAIAGCHPKSIQQVMRHSSITLTMDTYGHLFPGQEADTVARLPVMFSDPPAMLLATGTDAIAIGTASAKAQYALQQSGRETVLSGATGCEPAIASNLTSETHNPFRIAELCEAVRENATASESAPPGTRTQNPLIKSQML